MLRLPPQSFWQMTLRELALAIEALSGPSAPPLNRPTLNDLMARYPDGR